ncbi:1-phosphofructokinase [Bacillus glycinifermentans]|uniref:1-phosphofructokinase n=1 Tax=Bacillus glycinifermentans TaxID=1664069 RepID=UPI001FF63127|nr:1-phosphofructokinase [Bacillus glycinifermentans]UOY86682.1 1-phosphofructokinase [Bacillus glycinifermentans]
MIYTCTMNTAVDLFVETDDLLPDIVNRTKDEDYQPNGKGVNISFMLKRLGLDNTALGFTGGFTGRFIEDELKRENIATDFVKVDGISRINIFINSDREFKIVNKGPFISETKTQELTDKIRKIPSGHFLFISGSLPKGIRESIYPVLSDIAATRGIKLVLDISSPALLDCLPYRPYLIKPNEQELATFFGQKKALSEEEVIHYGGKLLSRGAERVLVTRGKDGAIYLDRSKTLKVTSAKGKVVNTACAGDAMLAVFIGKQELGMPLEDALKQASAAGALTAFAKGLGDLSRLDETVSQIRITHL